MDNLELRCDNQCRLHVYSELLFVPKCIMDLENVLGCIIFPHTGVIDTQFPVHTSLTITLCF